MLEYYKIEDFIYFRIRILTMESWKKARIGIVSLIMVALAVLLLIYLIKNGWDMRAAAKDIMGLFGGGKK